MFFFGISLFSMIQWMLAIWSLVPLPFRNPACTSGVLGHVLLQPSLKNFKHYLTGMWNECTWAVVWTFFGTALLWDGMKTELFQSCGHCWIFQICSQTECSTFTTSSLRILKSSARILSPPLPLFVVMLPKAHLTSHSRVSGSRGVTTP